MSGRLGLVALALVLAACEASPSETPTPTPTPEPTAVVTIYTLGTTVWYAGLVMTFGDASAKLDQRGGRVTIDLRLDNPGQDDLTPDSPIRLVVGGTAIEPTHDTVFPSVPAGGGAFATLAYDVIGRSSVDDGVIQIGNPDLHQAIIPLRPGAVAAVTLQPVGLALKGTTTASDLRLVLTHGVLRWDLPDWADELPAGSASLTLTYNLSYGGTFSGGIPFTGDNVNLVLPNGHVLHPRVDGRSQSLAVIGPGQTLRNLFTRFEIPSNLPGTYTLVVGLSGKQGRLKFVLPG